MKSTLEKHIVESYNKKAAERDTSDLEDWKTKERETYLNIFV